MLTNFQFAERGRWTALHFAAPSVRRVRAIVACIVQGQHERGIVLPDVESAAAAEVFRAYAAPRRRHPRTGGVAARGRAAPTDRAQVEEGAAQRRQLRSSSQRFRALLLISKVRIASGAPEGVGLSQYPGGREYYQYLIELYTTLTITPEKLHALGLSEVDRLNTQLDGIRRQVGFKGTLVEFKHYLATDPQFFPKTTVQFGERLEVYVGRSAAAAPRFFLHMPTAPYGVAPLPARSPVRKHLDITTSRRRRSHRARISTTRGIRNARRCYGRRFDLSRAYPGPSLSNRASARKYALPNVRRYDFSETGFVEGWGEYASQLCWEMGVYETPYDKAGRIMQDLMVSTRLVVDTGMNALGWSRERAMAYMRENLTLSEAQIESETLRYSTDIPGQALAYKTGELHDARRSSGRAETARQQVRHSPISLMGDRQRLDDARHAPRARRVRDRPSQISRNP